MAEEDTPAWAREAEPEPEPEPEAAAPPAEDLPGWAQDTPPGGADAPAPNARAAPSPARSLKNAAPGVDDADLFAAPAPAPEPDASGGSWQPGWLSGGGRRSQEPGGRRERNLSQPLLGDAEEGAQPARRRADGDAPCCSCKCAKRVGLVALLASAAAGALICVVLTFVQNCPFNKGAAGQLDDGWRAFGLICEAVAGGAFALLVARGSTLNVCGGLLAVGCAFFVFIIMCIDASTVVSYGDDCDVVDVPLYIPPVLDAAVTLLWALCAYMFCKLEAAGDGGPSSARPRRAARPQIAVPVHEASWWR